DAVEVEVSLPSARCTRCGKEQALAQRSRLLGVLAERLPDAVIDLLSNAGIAQRRPVPEFQASPYASGAAIVLFSLMLVVAFLIVLSVAPVEVKSSPLFWIAVVGWALIAFPFFPPDEIPGVRPPGKAGLVGSTVLGAAFLLFMAGVVVKDMFPIAQIGFGATGGLLALGAWFIYSYLWTARISTCTLCGTYWSRCGGASWVSPTAHRTHSPDPPLGICCNDCRLDRRLSAACSPQPVAERLTSGSSSIRARKVVTARARKHERVRA